MVAPRSIKKNERKVKTNWKLTYEYFFVIKQNVHFLYLTLYLPYWPYPNSLIYSIFNLYFYFHELSIGINWSLGIQFLIHFFLNAIEAFRDISRRQSCSIDYFVRLSKTFSLLSFRPHGSGFFILLWTNVSNERALFDYIHYIVNQRWVGYR